MNGPAARLARLHHRMLVRCIRRTYRASFLILYSFSTAANDFIAGAIGGTVATFTTYPFDILRTRLAAQGDPPVSVQ